MAGTHARPFPIRPLEARDLETLDAALMAAYKQPRSMLVRLQRSLERSEAATFVALDGDRPVGYVCANNYGASAYVELMGVDPAYQGCGLGRSLMRVLLAWADERAISSLELDATASGAPLYASEGFVDDGETIVFEGVSPQLASPLTAMQASTDRASILRADREAFGTDRRGVLEMLLDDPQNALFARGGDAYAVAQEDTIGPVIAADVATAKALIESALSVRVGRCVRACVPSQNEPAAAIVRVAGLTERRRLKHMLRGAPIERRAERIFTRINLGQG